MARWIAALLALALAAPALAGEAKTPSKADRMRWQMAQAAFQKGYRSKKAEEREAAAKALGDAVIPGEHNKAARLLVGLLAEELARGREKEEETSFRVIEAAVEGLRKLADADAVTWLLGLLKSDKQPWRVKYHLIEGLGARDNPAVVASLLEGAADADPKIRIASLEVLGRMGAREGLPAMTAALRDEHWQVQVTAIEALRRVAPADDAQKLKMAEALIERLREVNDEGGRIKWEIVEALKNLTGEEKGYDVMLWDAWLARQRSGRTEGGRMVTMPVIPTYHGVKIWSTRVVFVIDVTGSMSDPASKTEAEPKPSAPLPLPPVVTGRPEEVKRRQLAEKLRALQEENDKRPVRSKMDAEKRELVNAVLTLDEKVFFTIVFYSEEPLPWRPALVPATAENKIDAVKEIEKVGPFGGTDIYKALLAAFGIPGLRGEGEGEPGGKAAPPKVTGSSRPALEELAPPADEIFLLTDGDPTVGDLIDTDRIREEIRKLNRTRRVRLHTVAVGAEGVGQSPVNLDFLRKLAEENGGKFVHVR